MKNNENRNTTVVSGASALVALRLELHLATAFVSLQAILGSTGLLRPGGYEGGKKQKRRSPEGVIHRGNTSARARAAVQDVVSAGIGGRAHP